MKIVLSTWSSEVYNADCDFALVDLTPALAGRILARMILVERLYQQDLSVHELSFWDSAPQFFTSPVDEQLIALLPADGDSYTILPDDQEVPANCFQSTEGVRLVIDVCGRAVEASWRGSPKHVAVCITTTGLPRQLIEQAAYATSARGAKGVPNAKKDGGREYLLDIDGPLLRRQRQLLAKLRGQQPAAADEELVDGLINLTDAIADQAHDLYGIDCLLDQPL